MYESEDHLWEVWGVEDADPYGDGMHSEVRQVPLFESLTGNPEFLYNHNLCHTCLEHLRRLAVRSVSSCWLANLGISVSYSMVIDA